MSKNSNDLFDLVKAFILTIFGLSGSGMILYSILIWNDVPLISIVFALTGCSAVFFSMYELLCLALRIKSALLFSGDVK